MYLGCFCNLAAMLVLVTELPYLFYFLLLLCMIRNIGFTLLPDLTERWQSLPSGFWVKVKISSTEHLASQTLKPPRSLIFKVWKHNFRWLGCRYGPIPLAHLL